jgi:L-serine dehydratase
MAAISVFDIFKIGVGPSSSHTVGPMKAARAFADSLDGQPVASFAVTLFGSLAWTGKGHGTDSAILLGLGGYDPETVDPDAVDGILASTRAEGRIDIEFNYERELGRHTNGMTFVALDEQGNPLRQDDYFSLGGGFIARNDDPEVSTHDGEPPLLYSTSQSLLELAEANNLSIADLVFRNEQTWRDEDAIIAGIDGIWTAMNACIDRGMRTQGVLPGKMSVLRRAYKLANRLRQRGEPQPLDTMEWVNVFAIAVNEENASGGRVVTSPTNGAAGIIPAVLRFYVDFVPKADKAGIRKFLLTAGAIGILYKVNASISGAEMGCQGEVGVACSMAAGGLAAALGGSNDHIEEAAEIGMEHNLGLTCDPIGGLVQIPCIERNAMGAVKAINAAKLAMHGDGTHKVTLDQVIATMRQTGLDMSSHYKETSKGGLAVNVPEC